MTINKTED